MTRAPLTPRFDLRRQLGSGGMGVVYEAYDHERQQIVALKKLLNSDGSAILRLKTEFRSLADVAHPNLISLYELINENEEWFFTMELIDGKDFVSHVRPAFFIPRMGDEQTTLHSTAPDPGRSAADAMETITVPGTIPTPDERIQCPARLDVLREAMRQLTDGVAALHRAGKLHCDLKPQNVLVTPQGRVVVLDFGVVADVITARQLTMAGTPAYMSPEQFAEQKSTEASDWYAVGLMLYEALTGVLPFDGTLFAIMAQKREIDPRPPSELASGVPEELNQLCMALLRRDPRTRPGAAEILRHLGREGARHLALSTGSKQTPFIGRATELRQMHEAAANARSGRATLLLVKGRSGLGKTALTRHFIDELLHNDRTAVVLSGRCYEHESVPYKAFDSLIDSLVQYLSKLKALELKAVLPRDIGILARLFPVLDRIDAVQKMRLKTPAIPDAQETRRRAFAALREMFARIADDHSLVLFVDDLQWGDRDSAQLVAELLRPPQPPGILLIGTYRGEEAATSAFLTELRGQDQALPDVREIVLEDLLADDARDLARAIVGSSASEERVEAIMQEAAGSPFFIQELGRLVRDLREDEDTQPASLDDVIRARVRRLPPPAQRLLEFIAIAGQPIAAQAAQAATAIEENVDPYIASLRAENLVRTRLRGAQEEWIPYHDRVREAVVDGLDPAVRRERHLRLATALEEFGGDAEVLSTHFERAGEKEKAAAYAFKAADNAANALAFDHAAKLYRYAIDVIGMDTVPVERVVQLADALGNAGRSAEAAGYYLRVAKSVEPRLALDMRRRASEHLLRSAHMEEGMHVIRDVLASVGMQMPATPLRAVVGIIARRLMMMMRGLRYDPRAPQDLDPELLMKVDVLWAATVGLVRIDNIRAAYFQTLHLPLALKLGDPYRVSRAISLEAGLSSVRGGHGRRRIEKLLEKAERQARALSNVHADGLAGLASVSCNFYLGKFRNTHRLAEDVERLLRENCTSVTWEIDTAQNVGISALYYLGEIRQLGERIPPLLRHARERGDRYAATELVVGRPTMLWLAWDEPDAAENIVESTMREWKFPSFHIQHFKEIFALAQVDLYRDHAAGALRRVENLLPALAKSMNLRIQFVRIEALHLRARCLLRAAAVDSDAAKIAEAEKLGKRILKEHMAWALPLGESVLAGAAELRGQREKSTELYGNAARNFEKAEMALFAAAARRRLGELTNNEALVAAADEWMRAQDVKVPEKLARVLVP